MSRSRKSVAEILNSGEFVGPLPQGVHCRPCYVKRLLQISAAKSAPKFIGPIPNTVCCRCCYVEEIRGKQPSTFQGPLPPGVDCRKTYVRVLHLRAEPIECNCGEAKSVRNILRDAGLSMSGQKRKLVAKAIDDALFSLWQAAFEREGGEYAACILATVIARDPTYEPELWALYTLRRHRAAVTAVLRANPQ